MIPIHLAALGGHLDVVKYLVGAGADLNAKVLNGVSEQDCTTDCGLFHQK